MKNIFKYLDIQLLDQKSEGLSTTLLILNNPDGSPRWICNATSKKPSFLKFYLIESLKSQLLALTIRIIFFLGLQRLIFKIKNIYFKNLTKKPNLVINISNDNWSLFNKSLLLLLFVPFFASAQVGINTTTPNPNSALDVNGRIVIQDLSRTGTGTSGVKILLIEQDGSLIEATLDANLISEDNNSDLTISNNSTNEKIVLINQAFGTQNNWDLELDGDNSDVTVIIIRKSSGGNELKIRGIKGGTDGRKIRIINDSDKKIKFEEDHNNASSGNKIYIFTSENEMSSYGSCELIYSTVISDDGGHWNLVQLDKT